MSNAVIPLSGSMIALVISLITMIAQSVAKSTTIAFAATIIGWLAIGLDFAIVYILVN